MKNIHILPTDKPSRLFYSGNSSKLTLNKYSVLFRVSPQNIYITNDEEIKVGDWFISLYSNSIQKELKLDCTLNKDAYKKIILTTDQDLIADGIQAIDDEFLEWFVKNPTCEEVVVEEFTVKVDLLEYKTSYKIIIPKEEPKQETLEEAVEIFAETKYQDEIIRDVDVTNLFQKAFVDGAKWQQERSYSEEEVIQLVSDWTDYRMSEDSKSKVTFKKWFKQFKE